MKTQTVLRCKTNRRELTCAVLLFDSASVLTCFDLILRVFWRHSFPWKPLNKSFLLSFCFQIKFGEPCHSPATLGYSLSPFPQGVKNLRNVLDRICETPFESGYIQHLLRFTLGRHFIWHGKTGTVACMEVLSAS